MVSEPNPLVSVLMTAYNREKYIAEAIESVLASTYTNFELIIVDDCSKDNTVKIAEEYAAKDERINVYVNETNLGDYPNRNRAASYAKGKYIKYVDADDLIYPWGLEILINCMERFPDAGWGLCSLEQDIDRRFPFLLSPKEIFEYHYYRSPLFHKAPLSSIIKTETFQKVNGFTGKQHVGDCELWHILAKSFSLVLMPHGIVWARKHEDQQMAANRNDPRVPFKYWVGAYYFFKSNVDLPISNEQRNFIIKDYKIKMNKLILVKVLKMDFKLAYDLNRMKNNPAFTFENNGPQV